MGFMQLTSLKKRNYNNKALSFSIHKEARYRHLFQVNVSLKWLLFTGFLLVYTTAVTEEESPLLPLGDELISNAAHGDFLLKTLGAILVCCLMCLFCHSAPALQGVYRHTVCPFQGRRHSRAMAPSFMSDELERMFRAIPWSLSSSRALSVLACAGELSLGSKEHNATFSCLEREGPRFCSIDRKHYWTTEQQTFLLSAMLKVSNLGCSWKT